MSEEKETIEWPKDATHYVAVKVGFNDELRIPCIRETMCDLIYSLSESVLIDGVGTGSERQVDLSFRIVKIQHKEK